MSIKIKDKRVRRFSFNHVDSELHASIHAKSPMYAIQHHEEYEQKALPVNSNSLQFKKVANEHLVACLYTDKDDITKASNEFKQNLILFYIYLTLYLSIFLGFSIAMHSEGLLPTSHLLIHLTVLLLLLLLSYLLLFLILHNCLLLKSPQLFLALGFCIYLYLIFADPRVLYKFTGEAYFDNHIPMVLGLITLIPMLRLVIFDSYIYIVLLVVASFVLYIIAQLAFSPLSRLATLSEIALVGVFSILQIIDSHRSDLRIKHIFWRREKETVVNKENNANAKFRNSSINSDVEVIMDSCDQIKKKLKYVTRIVMYSEVKKIIKENILEIEKIKWKVAHRQDVKVIIDPNIDEEDREYIQQNCVDLKYFKSEGHERVVTEVSEKSKRGIHLRYSMHDVENALSAFGKNWNFDIWFIYNSTGESVGVIGKYLFSKWQINESFLIPTETTENYFKALEKVRII